MRTGPEPKATVRDVAGFSLTGHCQPDGINQRARTRRRLAAKNKARQRSCHSDAREGKGMRSPSSPASFIAPWPNARYRLSDRRNATMITEAWFFFPTVLSPMVEVHFFCAGAGLWQAQSSHSHRLTPRTLPFRGREHAHLIRNGFQGPCSARTHAGPRKSRTFSILQRENKQLKTIIKTRAYPYWLCRFAGAAMAPSRPPSECRTDRRHRKRPPYRPERERTNTSDIESGTGRQQIEATGPRRAWLGDTNFVDDQQAVRSADNSPPSIRSVKGTSATSCRKVRNGTVDGEPRTAPTNDPWWSRLLRLAARRRHDQRRSNGNDNFQHR